MTEEESPVNVGWIQPRCDLAKEMPVNPGPAELRPCSGCLLGARRSNLSILKEINPEYSLEGLMLKLKLQHFGHLI